MNAIILTLFSLSLTGSVMALLLLLLRPVLKGSVTRSFQYYIWLIVLIRLAVPFSFDGSLMNRLLPPAAVQITESIAAGTNAGALPNNTASQDGAPDTAAALESPVNNAAQSGEKSPETPANTVSASPATALSGSAADTVVRILIPVRDFVLTHLTGIWLLGAGFYFSRFLISYLMYQNRIRRTSVRPDPADMVLFAHMRGDRHIRLMRNPYVDTPMLIGFLSPCIILPAEAFAANGRDAELRHILCHELTHERRHDLLYKWLVVLISSVHWFNPLMIVIRREINRACELSCDEAVLRRLRGPDRRGYGETLLNIASRNHLPAGVVTTTMCEEKRNLKERLENIMTFKKKTPAAVLLSLLLVLALTGCGVTIGASTTIGTSSPSDTTAAPTESTVPADTSDSASGSSTAPAGTTADATVDTAGTTADATVDTTAAPAPSETSPLEAYRAVLENNAEFYSTDSKKSYLLQDFLTNEEIYGTTFDPYNFSVLDMNGDGAPEVVLELTVNGDPQFFEILHAIGDQVYGYLIPFRGLESLKADGKYMYSGGYADYGWAEMTLTADGQSMSQLGFCESVTSADMSTITENYYIDGAMVDKDAFNAYMEEQTAKADAEWFDCTAENYDAILG